MTRTATLLAGVLAAGCLAAAPVARAHPHVFIDTGIDFLFDAEGRIVALRVIWIYDPLTSLFMLEDLGLGSTAALGPQDRTRLAAYQTEWAPDFEGDSYVHADAGPVALSGPRDADAWVDGGRVVIAFRRDLEAPLDPASGAVTAEAYDPGFYTAYTITEVPQLEGAPESCAARVIPFTPQGPLLALQQSLLTLDATETPADPDIGALFADRIEITCD